MTATTGGAPSCTAMSNLVSLLPHQPPLRLLDSAEFRDDGSLAARQTVPMDGPMLSAHFPGAPIWPGALLVEAMAQTTAIWLLAHRGGLGDEEVPLLGAVDCRFLRPVLPGTVLSFETKRLRERDGLGLFGVSARDGNGRLVARARISAAIRPRAILASGSR
jgi:3-hydroxyacyl-[acyl-carrier-protein] dehydratase